MPSRPASPIAAPGPVPAGRQRSSAMWISDRLVPAALLSASLGLVSAFAFDGAGPRDGVAPVMSLEATPRPAPPAFGAAGFAAPIPPAPIPSAGPAIVT